MNRPLALLLLALVTTAASASVADHYQIETIATPPGLDPQVGGLAFSPSGKLFACFHRGEVYSYDPATKQWTLFASGLHEPLGLIAFSDKEVVVMQRPELTRLIDDNGDGLADQYQTICDSFGMSGNYHEFAFGPVQDADGNFIIALNVASNGATIFKELRGEFRHYGVTREEVDSDWSKAKNKIGRMFSVVPYRGWILKVNAKTGQMTPIACGVRSPNGLGFDAKGNLFVADNQGDWLGSSKLFSIKPGNFYGHPASLAWRPDWDKRNPIDVPVPELDKLRTRESVMFPQDVMANSPTQSLLDTTGGKFGPFTGQMFIGEMNTARVMRLMMEEVAGKMQGACVPFFDKDGLTPGNNRLAFDKDGALWVGHTHLSWAGKDGIQRISWKGTVPLDMQTINLTDKGFALRFTKPLAPASVTSEAFAVRRYYYEYHQTYGSPVMDAHPVEVKSAMLGKDNVSVTLELAELKPGYLYEFKIPTIAATDGEKVVNPLVIYTLNYLKDGTAPPAVMPKDAEKPKDKKKAK